MPLDFAPNVAPTRKQITGLRNYHDGLAAEDNAAVECRLRGLIVLEHRWRGPHGEIDLICRDGDEYVFVEVKKAATHDAAAERLTQRQINRIINTAYDYLADKPNGMMAFWRVDAALVDRHGKVEILTNITI